MESAGTTEMRLDELARRVDAGFAQTGDRLIDLGSRVQRLESQVDDLRVTMLRFGGGVMAGLGAVVVGLFGVIAALILSG